MIKTFTRNDLVRYLYQETTIEENHLIKQALLTNDRLNEEYFELVKCKSEMEEVEEGPSSRCVNKVMDIAKNTHIKAKL